MPLCALCFGGRLVAVRVVAMCCGAVGGRRMHTRLALGGWHCSGWSLVLSTGRCDHCWEGLMCGEEDFWIIGCLVYSWDVAIPSKKFQTMEAFLLPTSFINGSSPSLFTFSRLPYARYMVLMVSFPIPSSSLRTECSVSFWCFFL